MKIDYQGACKAKKKSVSLGYAYGCSGSSRGSIGLTADMRLGVGGACMLSGGLYVDAKELKELLGISTSKAYGLIRAVNDELKAKGYMTVQGKAPRRYLMERIACGPADEVKPA